MAHVRAPADAWDELLAPDGSPRPAAAALLELLAQLEHSELQERQTLAEIDILTMGITFTVYSDGKGIDRAWPFDIIPRVIAASEWRRIELGLKQRLRAINAFIDDLYHEQRIIHDGVFPADMLEHSVNFRPECAGADPAHGVWANISGSDLVRDADGTIVAGGWWRIDRYAADGSLIGPVALRGIWKLDIDPSNGNVVVTGERRFVSLFEPKRRAVYELGGTNLALSGDGRRLLVHRGSAVTIHDLTAIDPTLEIGRLKTGGWIATNGDASLLAAMFGADRAVHVFETVSGLERMHSAGAKFVTSNETFALSADGSELATIIDTASLRRVSTRDGGTIAEFDFAPSTLIRVRYVEQGAALMVLGISPPIGRRIDLATGRSTELPVGRSPSVIALSSDGRYFASAQQDGRIAVHDLTSGNVRDLGDRSGTVWSMTFDPSDPGLLVCSTRADGVAFWDVESGEMCYRWTVDDGPMAQLQISADGRWLAAYSTRGVVIRDLRFFDRHIAGNAERRIALGERLGTTDPDRVAAVREWGRRSRAKR